MNKLLAALNVGVGAFLFALVVAGPGIHGDQVPQDVATAATAAPVTARVVVPGSESGAVQIVFDRDMVTLDEIGAVVPSHLVRTDPEVRGEAHWGASNRLVLAPLGDFPPAERVAVHLHPELASTAGEPVDTTRPLSFDTPTVQWTRATIVDADDGRPTLELGFDLPVVEKELRGRLTVRRPDGTPIPFELSVQGEHVSSALPAIFALRLPLLDPPVRRAQVTVGRGLRSAVGTLATTEDQTREIRFREKLMVSGVRARSGYVELEFNRRVPLPVEGLIEVEPAVPFQVHRSWGDLRLVGDFPPGEPVTVRVAEGFPGKGRHRLAQAFERSVRMPDLPPQLAFGGHGEILSSAAHPELVVEGVNVEGYRVRVETLYTNNLVRLLGRGERAPTEAFRPAKTRDVRVGAVRNETFHDRIDLAEVLGGDARGIHRVHVRADEPRFHGDTRLVQVTDLAVTVRAARDALAVRVGSLARGHAVSKADVRVYTPTNQLLCRGTTDAEGLVQLPFRPGGDRRPAFVVAECDGDLTFLDLDRHGVELAGEQYAGRPHVAAGDFEAWVWSPQGVARPGEPLRATALVRGARGLAPEGQAVRVRWTSPDGRTRRVREHGLAADGLLVSELETTTADPTGAWTCSLELVRGDRRIGSTTTLLDTIVPDRLEAEVRAPAHVVLGSLAEVEVEGRWLDGGAAPGRAVTLHTRLDLGAPKPDGLAQFEFEPGGEGDAVPPGALEPLRGVLDEDGRAVFRVRLPAPDRHQLLQATFVAELADPGGRSAKGVATAAAALADHVVGIRRTTDGVELATAAADGTPWPEPVDLSVAVLRRERDWEPVEGRDGRLRWQYRVRTTTLQELDVQVVGGRTRVPLDLPAPERGWLVVQARRGELVVETDGTRRPERPDLIQLDGPDEPVAAGTTLRLPVTSPVRGRALVTVEGRTIHSATVVEIHPGRRELAVELPAGLEESSVHVVASVWVPQARRGEAGPYWLVGGCAVRLDHPERAVEVELDAPATVRPGSTVDVSVVAPGTRRAVVALVDEGVLRLTDHASPDPAAWFSAARSLSTDGADTGTRLLDSPRFDPGILFGGGESRTASIGGHAAAATASHIRTLALVSEPLRLDDAGRATHRFELPPYEGRLRAMVVAAGSVSVGGASAPVHVTSPLGASGSGPRTLVQGDRSELVFTLRNRTSAAGDVTVRLIGDAGLELGGDTTLSRSLGPGRGADLVVPVHATGDSGTPNVRLVAEGLGDRREAIVTIGLSPGGAFERRWVVGEAGADTVLEVGDDWLGPVSARLAVSTDPLESLRPAVESLVRYPHGCLEQTTSRGFALLAALAVLCDDPDESDRVREYLQAAVDRVSAMQRTDGAFGWWPGSRTRYDFGTAYATEFLLEARAGGATVQESVLRDAGRATARIPGHVYDVGVRCYAVDVASRCGLPVDGWLDRLVADARNTEDRARLARTLHRVGRETEATQLLTRAEEHHTDIIEFGGFLRSPLRTRAALLSARLSVGGDDPRIATDVATLTEALLAPGRRTTQELAQSLRPLARYHAARAHSTEPFSGWYESAGERHTLGPETATLDVVAGATVTVGGGEGLARLTVEGRRPWQRRSDLDGFRVHRTVVDLDTGGLATGFRRGGRYEVRLIGHGGNHRQLLLTDVLPAGLEIESAHLAPPSERPHLDPAPSAAEGRDGAQLFFLNGPVRKFELAYRVRAVVPGRYAGGALTAECLYDPLTRYEDSRSGAVEVTR